MAMMTGRVLLVCALCMLWWGLFGIAADGAGGADGSAVEYLFPRWRAQLRSECAEEVGRRTGGGVNDPALEECVRRRTDGVRAVVDGRGHWRPQQFVVVATSAGDTSDDYKDPGSLPEGQSGSVAQLTVQQPLKPAPSSVPGSADNATEKNKPTNPAQPLATGEKINGELIEIKSDDEGTKGKSEDEGEKVEENDDEADGNAGSGTSDGSQEQGKQKAGTGQGASGGTAKENVNVVAGSNLAEGAAASPPVVSVNVENPKSVELIRDDVGGRRQTREKTVQEPPAVKLKENVPAELISTEDAAEGEKQKTEEKAEEAETKEEQKNAAEKSKEETPTAPEKKTKEEQKDKEVQRVRSKNEEKETDGAEPPAKKEAEVEKTAAFKNIHMNNITKPGDSDGSTAVSHTTSPLLLLVVVACAAAAAVVAA
ncbi:Mucin-associated surface protein (MASP) [Trypanosoma cruzi]|uniref:Mucin-associated surface protein (MASP), putative n=2 Tax=Trypanosoma cruzi TaxID=5693 RepID=Q4E5V3_TRYCC|nr:mucin-associated surface protein (MASP), putative [Trypanosoma cruzi]EAO00160.1 mucin-associated surface protein (MASP), putative [Trypanosoma cruzi]PWV21238.1 Mucin-associated surface protein (MASP) [Trypanosoma cruzi]|eukprot:XP_822011.1 mucin-associated surface protein (MASP) [Trypanosoma cruzi strain CL Brener]